jgi:hypothetical protein
MPYKSQAQAGYFHEHPEKVGGAKVVAEWDAATKGNKLPKRVKKMRKGGLISDKAAQKHGIEGD